ncbi:MAG: hypothetical protein CL609_18765 [Anaerolineaceae bacterium]|nr:hypothetical protein [Anaerolineaceae bacterium]
MKTYRVIYHMARADFLERTRRYSFLIMIGLVMWIGYAAATGKMIMRIYPDYTGELNSAWIGTLMALTVSFFLGWFGFYLVKGSVARDYETGVGQIMATTPLTRPLYLLGKWLSNFALLGVMILLLMAVAILMNLFNNTPLNLWALLSPLLIIALPCMAVTASIAVLFEIISWLRGGLGNIVYFIAFLMLIIPSIETPNYLPLLDILGFRLIGDNVANAARAIYPESTGAFTFTITTLSTPKFFPFTGIEWKPAVVIWRIVILFLGMSTAVISSIFFDRFSPSHTSLEKKKTKRTNHKQIAFSEPIANIDIHLTPLPASRIRFRFDVILLNELKLLMKGQRWWWYMAAIGLVIAQFVNTLNVTYILLIISWLWITLLLSKLGSREIHHNTHQIVFSTPHPVVTQLPAIWFSAFTLTALTGSGALVKFIMMGNLQSILAWLGGAIFIPSLALFLGVLTGTNKLFEIVYVLWMYLILQKIPSLDFVGLTIDSPWKMYLCIAFALMLASAMIRQTQLKTK